MNFLQWYEQSKYTRWRLEMLISKPQSKYEHTIWTTNVRILPVRITGFINGSESVSVYWYNF